MKEKWSKIFLVSWYSLAAVILLITLSVYLGKGEYLSKITKTKTEEITYQAQAQINQMLQQGRSQQQIDQLLTSEGRKQALVIYGNIKTAAKRSFVLVTITTILLTIYLKRKNLTTSQKQLIIGGLIVLLIIDMSGVARKYIVEDKNFEATYTKPDAISQMQKMKEPFRVTVLERGLYSQARWIDEVFRLNGIECIEVPSDSRPTPYRKLFFNNPKFSMVKMWQYSNVRFILGSPQLLTRASHQLGISKQSSFYPNNKYRFNLLQQPQAILEYTNSLARIYAVGNWIVETDLEKTLDMMNSSLIDCHKTAVLMSPNFKSKVNKTFKSSVNITKYKPTFIEAEVELSNTGLVALVSEPSKGWHASIDAVDQPILRCNMLHQGIMVPPGKHTVIFNFYKIHWSKKVTNWSYLSLPILILFSVIWFWKNNKKEKA